MWPQADETLQLLCGAREGDAEAVNRLMERHRTTLCRMVQSRLNREIGRRVDASDIVQETLIEAHRRLTDYLSNPRLPFHVWLRQLAKDRLVDAYRRQSADKRDIGRERPLHGDRSSLNPAAQIPDQELTPAAAAIKGEFEVRFHAALNLLSDDAREIIVMRHCEQLTNSQAAQLLQLSEPAAGMRYLRALRQLKSCLRDSPSM